MKALNEMKLKELTTVAKSLGIKGWWSMKKEDLIEAIKNESVEEVVSETPDQHEDEVNVTNDDHKENVVEDVQEAQETVKKRKNQQRLIEYKGETKSLTAWAKELGIRHQTLYNRIVMKGMDPIEAFETPVKKAQVKEVKNVG